MERFDMKSCVDMLLFPLHAFAVKHFTLFGYTAKTLHLTIESLRIDDFRTTAPLGHPIVPRRRPVEI